MRLRKPTTSLSDCLFAIASKFLCLISFLVCIVPTDLSATHIVGGDVTYRFVSFNQDSTEVTYDVTFNMYRDTESGGASFDDPAEFGVYRQQSNGGWEFIPRDNNSGLYNIRRGPIQQIPIIDDPCREEPDNVGVEATVYTFRITL